MDMMSELRRLFRNSDATAAVEAAIFAPIFLLFTLGITDLGTGMFVQMVVNAAAQSGATYAVINSRSTCASLTSTCLNGIKTAMKDATGNSSFCTGSVCTASFTSCADPNGGVCFIVSANYPFSPILPVTSGRFAFSWTQTMTYSSTVTVRVPTT
jgi:Flp pilus assembly protein TadG